MTSGWDATDLVERAWKHAGITRDQLAERTGISASVLSRNNNGQPLGYKNAVKIAEATGLTVFDLGAPAEAVPAGEYVSVLRRLQRLEEALAKLGPNLGLLAGLPERVLALEQKGRSKRRPGGHQ